MTTQTPDPPGTTGRSRAVPITISVAGGEHDGARTLAVGGEIDLASIDGLRAEIRRAIEVDGVRLLTVDLDEATFLDSSGIGVLIFGRNLAARTGAVLRVVNAHGMVRTVLQLTGALAILTHPGGDQPLPD